MPRLPFIDYQVATQVSTEITLNNDQTSPANILVLDSTTIKSSIIEYSVIRSGNVETGRIIIATSGADLSFEIDKAETSPTGILISCLLSGSDILVQYVSTNTGQTASFRYTQRVLA